MTSTPVISATLILDKKICTVKGFAVYTIRAEEELKEPTPTPPNQFFGYTLVTDKHQYASIFPQSQSISQDITYERSH